MQTLPIDAILPELIASLARTPNLVLEAPPGAGKTTRVPPALLPHMSGDIIVLEPRRIAARLSALRVASEMGEAAGGTVGYQVRFDEKISAKTRLRFVTEGILTRRLLTDPQLRGVGCVVLDEFHERHLDSDLALALLKRLQTTVRPDLKIVVMSATLDAGPIAAYLNAPTLRSEGRTFPLTVRHTPYSSAPLSTQVAAAVTSLAGENGNILVFLPGIAEIRRAERECAAVARAAGLAILPLHGDLSPAEQDRAIAPSPGRKLILSTNVAETSVTVAGVTAVIDSGLARQASHSPWTGLPTLRVGRISRASATQRAGRAARTAPGTCIRLFPEEDFLLRPEHDTPEIGRTDLSQLLLTMRALDLGTLDWLTPPPPESLSTAAALLDRLGATTPAAAQSLARFPLPPRLARVMNEAVVRGIAEAGARAAAFLSLGTRSTQLDLLHALDDPALRNDDRLRQHTQQLLRFAKQQSSGPWALNPGPSADDQLLLALLTGFPDRVVRKRPNSQVALSNGLTAELPRDAHLSHEFLLALDAEDRAENPQPLVRLTARVDPESLLDLFPGHVHEHTEITWNRGTERVEKLSSLLYDELTLEETRANASDEEAAAYLASKALEGGESKFIDRFLDAEQYNAFLARLTFAGMEPPSLEAGLRQLALGLHSNADLLKAAPGLIPLLEAQLDGRALDRLAPLTQRLAGGKPVRVHYELHRSPWIESRLQDFFGMHETPTFGPDRTPLTIELLAPNSRAVQTTTDLAGFWQRLYPAVRKELMRRYPRHPWPETPTLADAQTALKPRRK